VGDYPSPTKLLNQLFYLARFDPVVLPGTYDCELARVNLPAGRIVSAAGNA